MFSIASLKGYPFSLHRYNPTESMVMTVSRFRFVTSTEKSTIPLSGFERERLAARTVTRIDSASPGRTGASHRSSFTPGEPRLATGEITLSTKRRIVSPAVCQPLAISPP